MSTSVPPASPSPTHRLLDAASTAADKLAGTSSDVAGITQLRSIADTLVSAARRLSSWPDRGQHVTAAHLDAVLDAATARRPDPADVALRCDIMVIAAISAAETAAVEEVAEKQLRLIESLRSEVSQLREDHATAVHDAANLKIQAERRRNRLFGGRR